MSPRKQYSDNQYILFYNEVNGICPLCTIPLIYEKADKLNKRVNLAHIYPHSPTDDEKKLLKGVKKLSVDAENPKNIIWLCPTCHADFDKPRTLAGYNTILQIKEEILKNNQIKMEFYNYKIEDEIKQILHVLSEDDTPASSVKLEYDPTIIDNKTNNTMQPLTKKKIKGHVSEFYNIIKLEFKNIDTIHPNKAEQIATQIKSFYLEALTKDTNQENIYRNLVDWLHTKTKISIEASSIIISYFIQSCEVFHDLS